MQGNCWSEPSFVARGLPGPDLVTRKPGQCVLVTDLRLLTVTKNVVLESLYLRSHETMRTETVSLLDCIGSRCNMWLRSVTLQGFLDRYVDYGGVRVDGGQMYAEGAAMLTALRLSTSFKFQANNSHS
jgi:hypothetical protein